MNEMEVSKINEELADILCSIGNHQDQAETCILDEFFYKAKHLPASILVEMCDSFKECEFVEERGQDPNEIPELLSRYEKVKKRYKKESSLNKKQLKALKAAIEAHNDWLSNDVIDILGYIKNNFKLNQLEAIEVMQQYLEYAKNDYNDPVMDTINAELNESMKRND